jgi:hypothetical protein
MNLSSDWIKNRKSSYKNQTIFKLTEDIRYCHSLRFEKDLIVKVTNLNSYSVCCFIPLEPLLHDKKNQIYPNDTLFFFGGEEDTVYQFENLHFNTIILREFYFDKVTKYLIYKYHISDNERRDKPNIISTFTLDRLPFDEILFMLIMHDCNLLFINCEFHNFTAKSYVIEVHHKSTVNFINCTFKGKFDFKKIGNFAKIYFENERFLNQG